MEFQELESMAEKIMLESHIKRKTQVDNFLDKSQITS